MGGCKSRPLFLTLSIEDAKMIIMSKKYSLYIFAAILISYTFIFSGISILRYNNFLFDDSGDLLIFEQVIYNTLHGRPFYSTVDGQNHFGVHNSPILVLLVPFALLIPVPYVLYIFTVISIAVSAIPIYLIAREELRNELFALLLGTCYIMLPPFVGLVYQSFHEINLVLPFLAFAFYYFVKERFYPFMAMFVMALMVKEDVSLTLFMFTIYALIKKRTIKWCLIPSILSIIWLIISIKVVIPFFDRLHGYPLLSYFSHMGGSFSELLEKAFDPYLIINKLLRQDKLFYFYVLLLPMALVLPLFSSEIIFVLPSLFLNLLAENTRFELIGFPSPWGISFVPRHMSLIATVFLFISGIYSIKRVSAVFASFKNPVTVIVIFLIITGTMYSDRFIFFDKYYYRPSHKASVESIKRVITHIPSESTVWADRDVASHLYDRREVYGYSNPNADYVVIAKSSEIDPSFNEKYEMVTLEKGVVLFKRK